MLPALIRGLTRRSDCGGVQERQQQGAQGKGSRARAPGVSSARTKRGAACDTVFPVEPMAVPLGSLLAAEAV